MIRTIDPDADHAQLVTALRLGSEHRLLGRPALIALPDRTTGGRSVAYDLLSAPAALDALSANNLDLVDRPTVALEAFAWLAATVPVVRISYREASQASRLLRDLLADPPPAPNCRWEVTDQASARPAAGWAVAPSPATISVELGEDVVVFHRESRLLASLSESGSARWRSLSGSSSPPIEMDDPLVDELVQRGIVVRGGDLGAGPSGQVSSPEPGAS